MAIVSKIRTLLNTAIRPRLDSLAARLIAAAAVWTIIGLVAGGFILASVYRASVAQRFDDRLRSDLDELIAAAEPEEPPNTGVLLAGRLSDPRYERVYSGSYWQVTPQKKSGYAAPQSSRSLWDKSLETEHAQSSGQVTYAYANGPEGQHLRVLERRIEFGPPQDQPKSGPRAFTMLVAADLSEVENDVSRFNRTLFWSFLIFGAGLIALMFVQVRIALRPLRRVSDSLARIRAGHARRLEGRFPAEIAPLASELNSLIEHSGEVVARARTHVSNLAHSLKTPLTVLSSEASAQPGQLADAVSKQVLTMRRQVDHYLARGRAAGALAVLGNRAQARPVLDDLCRTLRRIHASRGIEIALDCPMSTAFRGERQDLEEMAGNLIDNACKWAKSRVAVVASRDGAMLLIKVEDDGPGLSAEDRERALVRGERLDESVPGSGLGLAIVRDIAQLYGGELTLSDAALGGLLATLKLPAIT